MKRYLKSVWTFGITVSAVAFASAQVLYSTSWEAPDFTAGSSAIGVQGWRAGSGSGASQTISTERARSGTQSLKWDNSTTNTSFYSIVRDLNWVAGNNLLVVRTYVWIGASTGADRLYGLYLSTGTLGSTVLGVTIGGDGKVRAGTSWGATYSDSGVIGRALAGQYTERWLKLELTYDRGSSQATATVEDPGNWRLSATFFQSTLPTTINLGTDYATTAARRGVAYYDDLEIRTEVGSPFDGWDETNNGGGDAGDLPETAQNTAGNSIPAIRGTLDTDDVDMYAIYIDNPNSFSATTVGSTSIDTQLWLFDANGKGVVFNDDSSGTAQSTINNSTGCIQAPGLYYLAISRYNRDAVGCEGGLIWNNTPYTGVRCPDGPESTSRVTGWSGSTASGNYIIRLTGVRGATRNNPDGCPPPGPEVWREQEDGGGDAGDLPGTAQLVNRPNSNPCVDPVQRIRGNMEADGVDMYVICITDPNNFSATTIGGATWDTQLWLFRCDGTGVVANDDTNGLQSRIDNSVGCLTGAGTYLLAISRYNRDPVDAGGTLLWSSGALSCANNTNPIAGWIGSTLAAGAYTIFVTGGYFVSPQGCGGSGCQGDVNSDGTVDDADLLEVLFHFGCTGFCGPSDVNRDGAVDDADLLEVLFHFGCGR